MFHGPVVGLSSNSVGARLSNARAECAASFEPGMVRRLSVNVVGRGRTYDNAGYALATRWHERDQERRFEPRDVVKVIIPYQR